MENRNTLKESFLSGNYDSLLLDVYLDENMLPYLRERFAAALDSFGENFSEDEVSIFSAPGRTEVGGNHTDHQHGKVLAASINRDAIAVVSKSSKVNVISAAGGGRISIEVNDLAKKDDEEGTTAITIWQSARLRSHRSASTQRMYISASHAALWTRWQARLVHLLPSTS